MHSEHLSSPHVEVRLFSLTSVDCWCWGPRTLILPSMHRVTAEASGMLVKVSWCYMTVLSPLWPAMSTTCCIHMLKGVGTLPHLAPSLSPYDFHIFDHLMKALKGCRFRSDDDATAMVVYWFWEQHRSYLWRGPTMAGASKGCLPQYPRRLFLMTSIPLPRTLTEWISFLQASCKEIKPITTSDTVLVTWYIISVLF